MYRGHGTYLEESRLCASVAGVVDRVNRLISVHPYKSRWVSYQYIVCIDDERQISRIKLYAVAIRYDTIQ